MKNPKLSVVMPTYNRPAFLKRMLDSVLSQEMDDFEILLINNGSTDGLTEEVCRDYEKHDKRVRFFSLITNEGPAIARNLGTGEATAEYIIHVDDDDYCEPNHFSQLYSNITENDADISISGCADEFQDTIRPKYIYEGTYVWNQAEAVSEFLKREKFHAAPATKMYRKSLFSQVEYRSGVIVDDIHLTYKLFADCKKAVAHGIPTYRFFKHGYNTTSFLEKDMLWPELLDEYLAMQKERIEYISQRVPEEAEHVRYAAWSYMISMVEKICSGRGPGCESQLEQMRSELCEHKAEFLTAVWLTEREKRLMDQYVLEGEKT